MPVEKIKINMEYGTNNSSATSSVKRFFNYKDDLVLIRTWNFIRNMEVYFTTLILINLTLREYEVAHTLLITSF